MVLGNHARGKQIGTDSDEHIVAKAIVSPTASRG